MLEHSPEEAHRRDGDLLRMAVVESVDGKRARYRVGELVTGPLPWFVGRAGKTIRWSKVSPGEQGMLLCPEGDVAAGVFLPGALSTAFDAPTTDDVEMVRFGDGAVLRYDPEAHLLGFTLTDNGRFEVTAAGGIKLTGAVDIVGAVTVSQGVAAHLDVVGAGVSLQGHEHLGVYPGSGVSGPPRATA